MVWRGGGGVPRLVSVKIWRAFFVESTYLSFFGV